MRAIGLLIVGLGLVGWAAVTIELNDSPIEASAPATAWVRTADGWEQSSNWSRPASWHPPTLHPGLVALAQVLFSTLALLAFQPRLSHSSSTSRATYSPTMQNRPHAPQSAQHLAVRLSLLQR